MIRVARRHAHGTTPGGKEERRKAHKKIMPYRPIYLWEITVNNFFTAVAPSWDSSPRLVNGRRARDRRVGHPRSGYVKVGVTSYGVCGHLLDSLSAWDHSDTLLKPEQAHFGRILWGYVFLEGFACHTEGRRDADHLIKT